MKNVFWSILLLTLLCGVCSAATLSVEPAERTCASGEVVDLTVMVRDVNNLGGFDFYVTWDPAFIGLTETGDAIIPGPYVIDNLVVNDNSAKSGRIRIAGVSPHGITTYGDGADLFMMRFVGLGGTEGSTTVNLTVNNYGFLNSTSGEEIPVSSITPATITRIGHNDVTARIATASNQAIVGKENTIIASVVNNQGVETASLNVTVWIKNETGTVMSVPWSTTIPGWGKFQQDIAWTPENEGTYTAFINVTNETEVDLKGRRDDAKTITAKEYTLEFNSDISGPWDNRASAGSWFYMYAYVKASQSGNAWFNITAPNHVEVDGGRNQTRYLYASDWNYVGTWMRTDTPGKINKGDIKFEIAANGKSKLLNSTEEVLIWVPSIRVSSVGATSVDDGKPGELTFNTLHTNNTYDNVTKIIVQSGARGRTLSGLEYLIGYPYGCVEQTTSKMLASLNVKNYYLGRDDKPNDWANIRTRANESVEGGVTKILKAGDKGQNSDGGWSLWGGEPSESSSSSYAGYTLARINMPEEDLNRLLEGKVISGDKGIEDGKVNFEKLIEWFHENPDNRSSGTWTWRAHVCHSWTPESNTAFVMLIHDMINQTVDVQEPYSGYMKDNMRNATRYFIRTQNPEGSWSSGDDEAMATALALWGLEAFAMTSDDVSDEDIGGAEENAKAWLIDAQDSEGFWPVGSEGYYGWYDGGRKTEATAYAVLALNATGIPADNETIQKGVGWLINQYEKGGGWGYTWASQVAIDALIHCQPTEVTTGTVEVRVDGELIKTFSMDATTPRIEYTLTKDQMDTLMAGGTPIPGRTFNNGFSTVKSHTLTATSTGATGPFLVSVDHSQSAPVNEIDGKIQGSRLIQSFGYEEEAGLLQVSTDIGILSDAPLVQEISNTYDVGITSTEMIAGEEADVTITVTSEKNIYSPMIEIPIAGFTFDNKTGIIENDNLGAFEVLNGTTGNDHPSLFIQSVGWEAGDLQTYEFKITPEDHGELDLDLRIRPLYDDTDVTFASETFTVMGKGNVSVNVVDEIGAPVDAESITLVGEDSVSKKSTHTFTNVLNGNYTLVVNGTGDHPSIRTAVRVTPDATALCNVTLPSSLTEPALVFSEGGAGSIASVEQKPAGRLSAAYAENTTYTVTVLGDGGELGIALEFPMRYLVNGPPKVKVNGENATYEFINGTFEYDQRNRTYSTTNATLIVYNASTGSNTIKIEFEGGLLGNAYRDDRINVNDALYVLHFIAGNIKGFETYDYPNVHEREKNVINVNDALYILHRIANNVNQYYN